MSATLPPARARLAAALSLGLLLLAASLLAVQAIIDLRRVQQLETDLAELHDVRYGLLNAEVWVEQLSGLLARKIDTFEVTEANRPVIKRNIEIALDRILVEVEDYLRRRNTGGDNVWERVGGALRQGVQDFLVDFDELRAQTPRYADAVIEELNRPQARAELKERLLAAVDAAADATFTATDFSAYNAVLARHGCADTAACEARLRAAATALEARARTFALGALLAVATMFFVGWRERPHLQPEVMVMLTAGSLVLLAGGVITPMIDVEARISELRFVLLGEPIVFTDQVLYFQSKSILDVVRVLLETGAWDMIFVAVLITLFSLVLPSLKVLAGFIYYLNWRGLRANGAVYFLALRSGKWSMADVLVVAMLMAYVGFSGLVESQLAAVAGSGRGVDVITTNGTALKLGFYLFLAFVLASLVLSALLEARAGKRAS
ncbi:paraquat-inducible protein A [Thiohalocapsa halophila]